VLHACRQHGCSRFLIGQGHPHGHQGSFAVWSEGGFNVVVGRGIRQVHPFDMHDTAVGFQLKKLAGDVAGGTFAVGPFVAVISRIRIGDLQII